MKARTGAGGFRPLDRLTETLVRPSRRISLLIVLAYVSATLGIALSVVGDVGAPDAGYAVLGIGLMAVAFVSLFWVSVTLLELRSRGPH